MPFDEVHDPVLYHISAHPSTPFPFDIVIRR
jgi:hypothetical protein